MKQSMIKNSEWAEQDTPIYKANMKGIKSLSDAEVISAIIGGNYEQSHQIAQRLLQQCEHQLAMVAKMTIGDMVALKVAGLTRRTATVLRAALELGYRRMQEVSKEREKICSSRDGFDILYPRMCDLVHEQFWVITLNRANKVIAVHTMSDGGLTGTVADPRKIFAQALKDGATSIILSHNHPSGNLTPSQADIDLTKKMKEGGKLLDICVFDHLIIAGDRYYSFADEGMI
jgi:DNA repair protein RadC